MPAAAAIAVVAAGAYSANRQSAAARRAANAQSSAADAGIAEQQRQFDAIQEMLAPYREAGTKALSGQLDLAGLGAPGSQQAAIDNLRRSPQFTSLLQQGEESILSNASATGGLRGGNTQAALAQFSPALLASTINDQYARLGGLAQMGQNAAAQTGSFGQQSTSNVLDLLQQRGAAQAGGHIAYGRGQAGYANSISQGIGMYFGGGGGGLGGMLGALGGGRQGGF
jgi:hypothetical protein